ncbi:MAG: hypothetical protein QOE05_388 [Actinomycetota bacterium]|nr:hypothetical protein [Actinomycetota bacterium]
MLPQDFKDLEKHLHWALPGDDERISQRLGSTVEEITAMYQAILPRFPEMMVHLGKVDPRAMSDEDRSLLCLAVAFVESADSVEYYAPTGMLGPEDLQRFTPSHGLLGHTVARQAAA